MHSDPGKGFSLTFQQGRRWLENLIEELTVVTSFEQSPEAMVIARSHIRNNKHLASTASCLEDLVFYRLGKEWGTRQGLTAMLEQVHLARFLGTQICTCY